MICAYNEKTRGLSVVICEVDGHYETDINGVFVFSGDTLKDENALFPKRKSANATQKAAKENKNFENHD